MILTIDLQSTVGRESCLLRVTFVIDNRDYYSNKNLMLSAMKIYI